MVMLRIPITILAILVVSSVRTHDAGAGVDPGGGAGPGCDDCHAGAQRRQWSASAHARGARNPIYRSLYHGTGARGTTEPGYKLDFPDTAGNCAACHSPGEALVELRAAGPRAALRDDLPGVQCRFCHDVAAIELDAITGRPHANMPGILSMELGRSGPGRWEGTGREAERQEPWVQRSEICAPCHDAGFWGTPIYASFAEWKASPYPARGQTCQHCHMRPRGKRGGGASHSCPGASDQVLLREAVDTRVTAKTNAGRVEARVSITNDGAGHHVPTGSPLRQLILVVRATDEQGRSLPLTAGPTVPHWGGVGDPSTGRYAGLPGKGFAKILRETWSGASPSAAYWNPTRIASDNRIAAFGTDTSQYRFDAPDRGPVRIEALLIYRRAFVDLAEAKGWELPDIVIARRGVTLNDPDVRQAPGTFQENTLTEKGD